MWQVERFNSDFRFLLKSITVLTTVLISGCGSSSSTESAQLGNAVAEIPSDTIRQIGRMYFSQTAGSYTEDVISNESVISGFAEATFQESSEPVDRSTVMSSFDNVSVDECRAFISELDTSSVAENSAVFFDEPQPLDDTSSFRRHVSAGEVIPITAPSGSWANLIERDLNGSDGGYYVSDNDPSTAGKIPNGSVFDIPGDLFPAFSNIPIPDVELFSSVSIPEDELGNFPSNNVITWDASQSDNTLNSMTIFSSTDQLSADGNLRVTILCDVIDDGEFQFPENVSPVLSDYEIPASSIVLRRGSHQLHVAGDSLLYVSNFADISRENQDQ